MPRTTKELIISLKNITKMHEAVDVRFFQEVIDEAIERLRQYDDLKEIIACGVSQLEEFIRDLEVHKK